MEELWLLWAKKKEPDIHYPLLCHLLDVVAVTREMWDHSLHAATRTFLSRQLNLPASKACQYISFWAGLHDIGKASPGFQSKSDTVRIKFQKLGFKMPVKDPGHGIITALALKELLKYRLDLELANNISIAVGGHHGVFPNSSEVKNARYDAGDNKWTAIRRKLFIKMHHLCSNNTGSSITAKQTPAFFMLIAGLISVADWIASNEDYFPYETDLNAIENHLDYASKRASSALTDLDLVGWQPAAQPTQMGAIFPFINDDLRPLQIVTVELAQRIVNQPGLAIIEAPMGEGKTEAAIYLADTWISGAGQKGCYFALPTMTTSDQMFGRVLDYLKNRYPHDNVNLMLMHGHASLSAEFLSLKKHTAVFHADDIFGDAGYDGADAGVVASEWFTYRKRGLLAQFGVGTVDQILLAVLQTRHVFVRQFGLAGKTVIIDEIHAYDTYMSTLLERLLEWLAALNSSVVMLSATLPKGRRDSLIRAYLKGRYIQEGKCTPEADDTRYPRIFWTEKDEIKSRSIETSGAASKQLVIKWVNGHVPADGCDFDLGKCLQQALSDGGCAAVICNTVDRAQQVYLALKPYFSEQDAGDDYPELDLLHARFLFGERRKREQRSLLRFGKPGSSVNDEDGKECKVNRPKRAVLVSTQIIEQSLDLDFDLMVTEMAPVDLLLQRAGRLHRHSRVRLRNLIKPVLWICKPEIKGDVPFFGSGTEAVYDRHVLLRSWLAIENKTLIQIPRDVELLIEDVYGEKKCPANIPEQIKTYWVESKTKLTTKKNEYEDVARQNRLLPPYLDTESMLEHFNRQLEEDDPTQHRSLQALTRYTDQTTISVICLFVDRSGAYFDKLGIDRCELESELNNDSVKRLLLNSIAISNVAVVHKLLNNKDKRMAPRAWKSTPLLRHHVLLFFNGDYECTDFDLRLDDELGLLCPKKIRRGDENGVI